MQLSEGIWILPLCGRVEGAVALADSVWARDSEARVVAVVGRDDPDAQALRELAFEEGWALLQMPGRPTAVEKVNTAFQHYPDEGYYGFLQNDMVVETKGALSALAAACPPFGLAYCDDGIQGRHCATTPCVGGELVRAQDFVFYPEAKHNGVDIYLMQIAHLFGGCEYVEGHSFLHNHHTHKRSPFDATYARAQSFAAADAEAERLWRVRDLKATILRVQRAFEASR